ncbi:MAG: type III-B CRISPR module RAMP protein Cmr4 [Opitutaceae bacterium]|jgi:CRISPR-associated protein Cmr4|nr:type III-B CRISPR module RAMP protein Cmr4 [Opitutaceae bacterium]
MQTRILHIFTRTPLHVGAGSSVGAIDQPVIRERHTGFPVIPGSALKGVIRDYAARLEQARASVDKLFGTGADDAAAASGALGFGEARLLAFPLRSAKGSYALATSPLALARYKRDAGLTLPDAPAVADGRCLAGAAVKLAGNDNKQQVALEEYVFTATADFPPDWAGHLSALLDDTVLREAKTRFVLLSDGDFSHFAVNACQVSQHVAIDHDTGTAKDGALFNTETVPSETLFYAPLHALREDAGKNPLFDHLTGKERLLQFGGDATAGLGFCTVKLAAAQ